MYTDSGLSSRKLQASHFIVFGDCPNSNGGAALGDTKMALLCCYDHERSFEENRDEETAALNSPSITQANYEYKKLLAGAKTLAANGIVVPNQLFA